MTLKELRELPVGTKTNYGTFSGLETCKVGDDQEEKTVALFDPPKDPRILGTVLLDKVKLAK